MVGLELDYGFEVGNECMNGIELQPHGWRCLNPRVA